MTNLFLWVSALLLLFYSVGSPSTQHPIPPGVREADKISNQPLEPPTLVQRRKVNPAELKREADELAKLANGIPAQIDQVVKGQLPGEMNENLKKIEKLAKRLHSQLFP